MIEALGGEGTIEKRIPAMLRMFMNYGIDMRKLPILVYPTLHYQNGGLEIGGDGFTKVIREPAGCRRGSGRYPRKKPPDGQLSAGCDRIWP